MDLCPTAEGVLCNVTLPVTELISQFVVNGVSLWHGSVSVCAPVFMVKHLQLFIIKSLVFKIVAQMAPSWVRAYRASGAAETKAKGRPTCPAEAGQEHRPGCT